MKRKLGVVVFAAAVAVSLSMPAFAWQTTASTQGQTKAEKQEAKKQEKAKKKEEKAQKKQEKKEKEKEAPKQ